MSILKKYFASLDLLKAFEKFPMSATFVIISTIAAIALIDYEDNETLLRIAGSCYLAFLTSIAVEVYRKRNPKMWLYLLPILMCIIWFFYLPADHSAIVDYQGMKIGYRFIGTTLILLLLISVIPFLSPSSEEDFWEYNKHLFLSIFESGLFSFIIFLGLAMAFVALEQLFEIDIDGAWYGRLLIFLGGIFTSLYFLSKYPHYDYDGAIEAPSSAYKVFSEYILIGITTIYLVLLYAYGCKIIAQGELPRGWIGYLTIFFSVIGTLTWLLNYFNPKFTTQKSTTFFVRHFFKFLTIPVIMLFLAIYVRVSDYGMTEYRYVVVAIAIWLLILTLMYGWLKATHIRFIPISLGIITAISVFGGPLNMFQVSLCNQASRLKAVLIENEVLANGQIDNNIIKVLDNEAKTKIKASVIALDQRSKIELINEWTENDLFENYNEDEGSKVDFILKGMNLSEHYDNTTRKTDYFQLNIDDTLPLSIDGYDEMTRVHLSEKEIGNNTISIENHEDFNLENLINRNRNKNKPITPTEASMTMKNETDSVQIIIKSISGRIVKGKVKISYMDYWLLESN